ncbi:unnamed protein product, partial [Discosporangium mesarthrocarpum]
MKKSFLSDGKSGLQRTDFVRALFLHLYENIKGLDAPDDAARVVAMLDELFDQIDINGNEYVDWEEFTSFCIELGILSGKTPNNTVFEPDDFIIKYDRVHPHGRGGPCHATGEDNASHNLCYISLPSVFLRRRGHHNPVAFMVYVPELQRIYYADYCSNVLKAMDTTGKPHHQYVFTDPYFVEGAHVSVNTVTHIPGRYLAVACSDHSINLMREIKDRRGVTHGYHCEAKVMHQLLHTKLLWEPCFQNLVSVGTDDHLYHWKLDDMGAGAHRIHLHPEHKNTITDIVSIQEKEVVVTSSLDKRVCVWQMPNWKLRTTFRDHTLGVQALSYKQGTLISAGFDWDIIAWDMERLEKIGTMTGHKAPVSAVSQMVCPSNIEDLKAVSADVVFEMRIWDLSGCIAGGSTIPCLMVFHPLKRNSCHALTQIRLPYDPQLSVKGYSNIIVGGPSVSVFAALKLKKEFVVPTGAEYNTSSAHFLCTLHDNVHIWDATSGEYMRKLTTISPSSDIVSACFAKPFERRLVLGTEDGHILLVNYVTGAVLDECHPHDSEVTQLIYCKESKTIISADSSGTLAVTSEIQCKLKELTVWGFQYLDFVHSASQSPNEPVTGLEFLDLYSIILLGDLTHVAIWHLDAENFKLALIHTIGVPVVNPCMLDVLTAMTVHRPAPLDEHGEYMAWERPQRRGSGIAKYPSLGDLSAAPFLAHNSHLQNEPERRTGEPGNDNQQDNQDGGSDCRNQGNQEGFAPSETCDDGKAIVALGTDSGRAICWTINAILDSMPVEARARVKPVPDKDCAIMSSSFNPYSTTVKHTVSSTQQSQDPEQVFSRPTNDNNQAQRHFLVSHPTVVQDPGTERDTGTENGVANKRFSEGEGPGNEYESPSIAIPEAPPPMSLWQAHNGMVAKLKSVANPPCFFSLGEDGFQRTWSLTGELLGQITLPNATQHQVKTRRARANGHIGPPWRFLVDAVQVRHYHETLTSALLNEADR